ncbi:hypothetical protein [Microbacterium sp. CPCC 204701]|uniref:hypothetical protein n=1 Tax=Microbacterium sp. CPCC 204701 TaxID=2493084 RepID=UPI000FDA4EB3|nr:hypothetical protein [Microbacterium sp. CPCC 204701]
MRPSRIVLTIVGLGLGGYGALLLVTTLSPASLLALAVWLVGVVVAHDAVVAPVESAVHARWWRRADRRPVVVTAVAQIGFVTGAILSLYVLPEIWAQGRGSPNPTILVGDYARRLVAVWGVIAFVVLVTWRVAVRRDRR